MQKKRIRFLGTQILYPKTGYQNTVCILVYLHINRRISGTVCRKTAFSSFGFRRRILGGIFLLLRLCGFGTLVFHGLFDLGGIAELLTDLPHFVLC